MLRRFLFPLSLVFFQLTYADPYLEMGVGYREDSLNWNIAGFHNSPDVLSELKWEDLQMVDISAMLAGTVCNSYYYRLNADYGKILHGKNRDSDYAADNRQLEYMRSENKANRGEVFDLSAGIGYHFSFFCDILQIMPLFGYAQMEQHLQLHDGFLKINLINGEVGPFPNLHSNYRARWMSPWAGVDFVYQPYDCLRCYGAFEYLWAEYRGTGHWNLRDDFLGDFKHHGHGKGISVTLAAQYEFWSNFDLGIKANYRRMRLRHGIDRTKFLQEIFDKNDNVIGEEVVVGKTRLNEVNWHSFRIEAILGYNF